MLLKYRDDFYTSEHPGPADVLLLIEVADMTLDLDLGQKLSVYAQAGISEYWVFDLTRKVLIVHRHPTGDKYISVQEHDRSAHVNPVGLPDMAIDLGEVFPN